MQRSFLKTLFLAIVTACALTISQSAFAQLVSSGMAGTVRGSDGKSIAGATVKAIHTPTNATFTATTNEAGRFNFRGLPVGGPYTVTAEATGYTAGSVNNITAELGNDVDVSVTLKSDVVQLEKFVVGGSRNALDSASSGAGSVLDSTRLSAKPTTERSFADMISANPFVTLNSLSSANDREEAHITAVGQNNRFNSIMIDGSRTNDVFGLNGTGIAAFFNPLSVDTIEQLSVQISPYDVRLSGFTGASINAVTKSGTNQFHGSAYYYFRGDHLGSVALEGYNPRELSLTGTKIIPALSRRTWGATLGGPIIKDRLFFFVNYEKYQSISAGRDPRFSTPSEAAILTRFAQYATDAGKTIDWGNPVTSATSNTQTDKKLLAKIDWNIMAGQRFTARYSKTDGRVPQFGYFANSSLSFNSVSGGIVATPDGNFYDQTRVGESYAAQLFSQWTPEFKTEVKYSHTTDDQLTPVHTVAPAVLITNVSGTDLLNNTAVTNGAYADGTEQFRQGNIINVVDQQLSASGDYLWKDFVFTGGFEREWSDYYNLFRQGSYGLVAFRSLSDFMNDVNAVISRNYYDPNVRPVADISEFATTGVFAQMKWNVNPRLNLSAGLRYEFEESGLRPALNQAFLAATGFRNDGSMDGVTTFSPRVGFNLALEDERTTQLRGGIGHFLGRSPWVFFSNSFGNTGVGSFSRATTDSVSPLTNSLTSYLKNDFDPDSPIGIGTDNPSLRREVDFNDDKIKLPSTWRGNLAIDRKLPFLDSTFTVEYIYSKIDEALFTTNENLKKTTVGADGRQRFAGSPGTQANALYPNYTFLYRVSNVNVGESKYVSFMWDRPLKDKWAFNLTYTHGHATEAQSNGQTTAGGQFNRNVIFNQNTVENGTADYEVKDRIQLSLSRQFDFLKNYRTTASLYYEGRSGNPYSWVFGGDLNGDGVTFNDTVVVPTGTNDPRFDFSAMTAAQQTAFFDYLNQSGLGKYAGKIVPKNSFTEPWVNRLDLSIKQDLPIHGPFKAQLALDFVNFGAFISKSLFGYTEVAPFLTNDVFRTKTLTNSTSYNSAGQIKPTFTSTPTDFGIDNLQSRWRIQVSAKIIF